MNFHSLLIEVAKILDSLKIPYAITGGFAVSMWGKVRSTLDLDVIIELQQSKADAFTSALKKISEINYVDDGMVERAILRKGEFNFIDVTHDLKVDFWVVGDDLYSKIKLKRRVAKNIDGKAIYFVSPEDLVLAKLIWNKKSESERQLADIKSVLEIQKKLDIKYIKKWAKKQSTLKILEKLLKEVS
ncbi:hypothetical protein HYT00_00365 [Candidatus Giovannonibacteria bacterium]|nr:hypothetical protein [Candidatus Giovannonibacteria bacterium]